MAMARWSDRLTIALGMPMLMLVGRAWVSQLPVGTATLLARAFSFIAAFLIARAVMARLEFHRAVGILAGDALQFRIALTYLLMLVGSGLASVALFLWAIDLRAFPSCLVTLMAGTLLGLVLGDIGKFANSRTLVTRIGHEGESRLRSPIVAVVLSVLLGAISLAAGMLATHAVATAVFGVLGAACLLALSRLDPAKIRFMAQSGYSPSQTVFVETRALITFLVVGAPVGFISLGGIGTALVLATGAAIFMVTVMRILAYRIHSKRSAEWVVSILLGAVSIATYSFPPALPLVSGAVIWWLWRSARLTTWLIA